MSDSEEMANVLQKQYCSVFSNPQSDLLEDPHFPQASVSLEDFNFTVYDIVSAIDGMRLNAAPGEDEVPVILLKSCRDTICQPLYLIWKQSFDSGEIHSSYLSSIIAPVFKGASKL